jgi:hypothetical protein
MTRRSAAQNAAAKRNLEKARAARSAAAKKGAATRAANRRKSFSDAIAKAAATPGARVVEGAVLLPAPPAKTYAQFKLERDAALKARLAGRKVRR